MILENEIEKLKRTHRRGPVTERERWQIVQEAVKNGMKGADLCELDYSLMSADERAEADRVWEEIESSLSYADA